MKTGIRNIEKGTVTLLVAAVVTAAALGAATVIAGEHKHGHASGTQETVEAGASPLVREMVHLDRAFREIVSAVAVGDGERVHAAIETMHGMKEATQEGVHKGEVHLRKNADRLDEFVALDNEFHHGLERLARSAERGNQDEMLAATKNLLDGCVACHRTFRE